MKPSYLLGLALPLAIVCVTTGCSQNRSMTKQTKSQTNSGTNQRTAADTSKQKAEYMRTSVSDGTATNNSNNTNYNSNNAVNNPTGAGSNPTTRVTPGSSTGNGMESGSRAKEAQGANQPDSNAGTAAAIEKAPTTSKTPAVDAGSTERNTSVGTFIASSPNYTTLQNAIQAADLGETLKADGAYTLFAPSNAAFKKLPTDLQGKLLDGSHKDGLKQLLMYHVVAGKVDAAELGKQIKAGNGKAMLTTLAGEKLTASMAANGAISLTDAQGKTARVTGSNVAQTNGIVHEVSAVLLSAAAASSFR